LTLVSKPDPRKKLIQAAVIDALLIGLGVVAFIMTGSPLWILLAILVGTGISAPLMISAMRQIKEQDNASR
jgi:multisubunit Na+/H+ antiporter MnhC subunit